MAAPIATSLSHLFTQLTGCVVTFVQIKDYPNTKIPQVYGAYRTFPGDTVIVVKADLPLVGSFAGALMGLPDSEVILQLKGTPIGEALRDAMYEVLNIASSAIAPGRRTVLSKVVNDLATLDEVTSMTLTKPDNKYCFNVSVKGYQGGNFAVLVQSTPTTAT